MKSHVAMLAPFFALSLAGSLLAGEVSVQIKDQKGRPVQHAVVVLHENGSSNPVTTNAMAPVQVIQKDREFIPFVTVIQVGTSVEFPNLDSIQHHIYSFSEAKTLDIPLYKDQTPAPVVFDKPGVVSLGCNIHDWMKAYVFVSDSPYFGISAPDGSVTLTGLPAARYRLEVWHPRLRSFISVPPDVVTVSDEASVVVSVEADLKKESARIKPADTSSDEYW